VGGVDNLRRDDAYSHVEPTLIAKMGKYFVGTINEVNDVIIKSHFFELGKEIKTSGVSKGDKMDECGTIYLLRLGASGAGNSTGNPRVSYMTD
jgi:hypothetical protein